MSAIDIDPADDLRPARTTPRLGLPVPGDAGPADYVTDTGAICDRLDIVVGRPLVSVLPDSPADGQEVYFLADAANGIVWHLRYRAASPSTYKWELVGGGEMFAAIDTAETNFTPGSWGDLATGGPLITAPLVGEYVYHANVAATGSTGLNAAIGLSVNGPDPTPSMARTVTCGAGGHSIELSLIRKMTVLAGQWVAIKYFINVGNATFSVRTLTCRPLRVG